MIYDCFMYHGTETDARLLELRLELLAPVVDLFVLVEATRTHAGAEKPLYYRERDQHRPRIAPYTERIIHVGMADLPVDASPLTRENVQRAGMHRGLALASGDDWVLVSDLDELPRPEAVAAIAQTDGGQVFLFDQRLSYYYVNCVTPEPWYGTRMARVKSFSTTQTLRHASGDRVRNAGWHMSYLGGVAEVQAKLAAYLHQEYNTPGITDPAHIERAMREATDLFDRPGMTYQIMPLDQSFPAPLLANPDRYADWFAPGTFLHQSASIDAELMPIDAKTEPRP